MPVDPTARHNGEQGALALGRMQRFGIAAQDYLEANDLWLPRADSWMVAPDPYTEDRDDLIHPTAVGTGWLGILMPAPCANFALPL